MTALGWKSQLDIKTAVEKVIEFARIETDYEKITCVVKQIKEYFGGLE
jgi:hypothetical protein